MLCLRDSVLITRLALLAHRDTELILSTHVLRIPPVVTWQKRILCASYACAAARERWSRRQEKWRLLEHCSHRSAVVIFHDSTSSIHNPSGQHEHRQLYGGRAIVLPYM